MALDSGKNFAKVTVSTGYNAAATSIVLTTGHAARLPAVPFNAVYFNFTDYPDPSDDPNVEIVRVTNISSETLTITRAQESTSASTKNTASKTYKLIAGPTAKLITDIAAEITAATAALNASNLSSGTVPDARFPATLPAVSGANLTNLDANDLASGTVPDARFPATLPAVSGANLTNLDAADLASGTIPDARFPATLPAVSGANLTNLDATDLASGTIPDARFPATLPAVSGANLTNLDANDLASGTIPDARFPATLPAASGVNLTALNATQLTSGTIPDARFPATLPAVSGANLTNLPGSLPPGWYSATDYGLIGNGVTDDTDALQDLIDLVATAGGGTIYFPPGCYLIAGPFQAGTQSQIKLPIVAEADPFVTIHLIGALPATNSFWYFSTDSPTGAPYSVIKSTQVDGSDVDAVFRGQMDVGAVFYNNLVMRYTNLILALPANPTYSGIDMTQDCGGWIDDCIVYAGTIDLDAVAEPLFPNSYGVKLPGSNHSSGTRVCGLAVTGFYNGLLDGEASQIDNVAIQGCQRGLVETHCVYPGMHGFVGIYFCPKAIVMLDAQSRYLTIRQLDLENPHSPQAAWQVLINHCDDPDDFLFGTVQWYGAAANVPSIIKDGGENLIFTKIGTVAGTLPPPEYSTGEIGSVSTSTVVIGFSEPIKASSYTAGVTVEVNAAPATISSATRQVDKSIVRYVLSAPVDGGDTVEFIYSAIDGFIQNEQGVHLADVSEVVTNNAAAGPFSPDEVTGLVLWLAADELVLSDNDPVATWADQSVAANDATQGTGGAQPTFKTAQINSLPVVRFDGTNDYLALDANLDSQDFTYFAVIKHTSANQGILLGHDNGGISWDFAGAGDQKPRLVKASTALVGQATTGIGSGYAIIAVSYATPNAIFYLNGAADGSASNAQTFTFASTGGIGTQFNGAAPTFWFAGDVAEIICYDNVVSGGDRTALFTYLNDKYAVY